MNKIFSTHLALKVPQGNSFSFSSFATVLTLVRTECTFSLFVAEKSKSDRPFSGIKNCRNRTFRDVRLSILYGGQRTFCSENVAVREAPRSST